MTKAKLLRVPDPSLLPQRERLATSLADLVDEHGEIDGGLMEEVRGAWPAPTPEMVRWGISGLAQRGEPVLDPFGGFGKSTQVR
ncbi:MAG: hypothetical protein AAGD06_15745 [Acidobacteriota bacterium]